MQFQIPQFIDTEDKIVGPLSLRQFGFLGGSVGVSMALYFLVTTWLWASISIVIVGAGAALAFVKVNGRPLATLLLAAASFFWRPRVYVWQQAEKIPRGAVNNDASSGRFSLSHLVEGVALRTTWQNVQVGTAESRERATRTVTRARERFGVVEHISGVREVAKRVDYR